MRYTKENNNQLVMKYAMLLAVVAAGLVTFGVYWLFGTGYQAQPVMVQTESASESGAQLDAPDVKLEGQGSLAELQQLEQSLECQIIYNAPELEAIEGSLFVAKGELRADFLLENADFGQYAASIIVLEDATYSWSQIEGSTYGVKLPTQTLSVMQEDTATDSALPVGLDEDISYDCRVWEAVDYSVFIPPSTVLFQDVAQLEQSGMQYGTIYEEGELPF